MASFMMIYNNDKMSLPFTRFRRDRRNHNIYKVFDVQMLSRWSDLLSI